MKVQDLIDYLQQYADLDLQLFAPCKELDFDEYIAGNVSFSTDGSTMYIEC